MKPSPSPLTPPDPSCAICSKPGRAGGFIQAQTGEIFHIRCRSEQLRLTTIEIHAHAALAIERSTDLVEETGRRRRHEPPRRLTSRHARCPVCQEPATLTDWQPDIDWTAVEYCPCRGFFAWTPLLAAHRLARLSPEDRATLSQRLRHVRAIQSEAWLTTRDATVMGALIVKDGRPDRWS